MTFRFHVTPPLHFLSVRMHEKYLLVRETRIKNPVNEMAASRMAVADSCLRTAFVIYNILYLPHISCGAWDTRDRKWIYCWEWDVSRKSNWKKVCIFNLVNNWGVRISYQIILKGLEFVINFIQILEIHSRIFYPWMLPEFWEKSLLHANLLNVPNYWTCWMQITNSR